MFVPVIIIGGGPAGAATALQLLSKGISCTILEAAHSPGRKPGETIPPQAYNLFKRAGISMLLNDPAHLVCYGNRFIWGKQQPVDKSFFSHPSLQGWHLDRIVFEQQLYEKVIQAGGQFLWNAEMQSARLLKNNQWEVCYTSERQLVQQLNCSFIVDATGRKSRFARKMSINRRSIDRLSGISTLIELSQPVQQYTYLESVENGWWYAAPLSNNQLVLSYMTDSDLIPTVARTAGGLMRLAATTGMIRELIANYRIIEKEPVVSSAVSGYLNRRFGQNWLAVGDAAYSYDPISSYGITSAIEGGYYAGQAINEYLAGNKDALPAYDWAISTAFTVYLKMLAGQYAQEQRWKEAPFWSRRY